MHALIRSQRVLQLRRNEAACLAPCVHLHLQLIIHRMANQSCGIGCTFQLGYGSSSAGVFVSKVRDGGPADVAGINAGDRLLGFFLDSKVSDITPFLFLALPNVSLSAVSRF